MVRKVVLYILILWTLVLSFYCYRLLDRLDSVDPNLTLYQIMSNDYMKTIKNGQSSLLGDFVIKNANDEPIVLDSILTNNILVVRYSELDCNVCVDTLINYAKKMSSQIGSDRIVVFAKVTNKRDFHLLSRTNKNELNIYQVNSDITRHDGNSYTYMFVLNIDHTISHLFIPHKEYPNMIVWYLGVIRDYLQ